jgi:hypothetical protein
MISFIFGAITGSMLTFIALVLARVSKDNKE